MRESFLHRFFATLGSLGLYVLAFLLGVFLVFSWFDGNFISPVDSSASQTVPFQVERDWSLQTLAQNLEQQGLIKNWWSVYWLAKFKQEKDGKPLSVISGEYELSKAMTPAEILEHLRSGKRLEREFVLPDGITVKEVAQLIAETGIVTEDEANKALRDQALMAQLGIPAFTPEGYLLAGSFSFARPITANQIIEQIVEASRTKLDTQLENWQMRASELGFRPYEVLTLASMLEKETTDPEERRNISAVYHNRLRIGMQLQSDAALAYGSPDFEGRVTKEQIQTPGPYNTYINVGLPPTPIASPSIDSIKAALHPAEADYLYYFRHPDGSYIYAATFKQHQQNLRNSGLPEEPAPGTR